MKSLLASHKADPKLRSRGVPIAFPAGLLVCGVFLFVFWYVAGGSVQEANAPGTYSSRLGGETVTLILSKDHLFREVIEQGGQRSEVEGSWRTFGEARIEFSDRFKPLAGQEICYGNASCGSLVNTFGFMRLHLGLSDPGIVFRKHLFAGKLDTLRPTL